MTRNTLKIPLLCGGFALLLRCGIWLTVCASPLGQMHRVPGLDMETLLTFSRWGNPGATAPLFVPHRMLIAALAWFFGPENCVPGLLLCQCLMGVAGTMLAADCARRLWDSAPAALLAGLGFAAYGPFLLYECSILQEALLLNGLLLTFWLLLVARDRGGDPLLSALAGISAGFFSCGRPAGVLFALLLPVVAAVTADKERRRSAGIAALCGMLSVWAVAAGFNRFFSGTWSPFFHVLPYAVAVNSGDPAAELSAGTLLVSVLAMLRRLPLLFSPWEYPENLNWYFFREQFSAWRFFLGPGLVLPLGVGALVWLVFSRPHWRKGRLLLVPLCTLAPLLAVRGPIGRYRLLLIPYLLLLIAGCTVSCIPQSGKARKNWRARLPEIPAGIIALALLLAQASARPLLRASDYVSWGIACEAHGDPGSAESAYQKAWRGSGFASNDALVRLLWMEQERGDFAAMRRTLAEGRRSGKADPGLLNYFEAKTALLSGDAETAENLLAHFPGSADPGVNRAAEELRQGLQQMKSK